MSPTPLTASNRLATAVAALACAVLVAGCSASVDWEEEVRTHDGRIVRVDRESTFAADEWGRTGRGGRSFHSITFRHNGRLVRWEHKALHVVNSLPLVADLVNDEPVIVFPVSGYYYCKQYDYPPEGLVAMRYRDQSWSRMALSTLPPQLAGNLLRSEHEIRYYHRDKFAGKLVRIADKAMLSVQLAGPKLGANLQEMSRYYAGISSACVKMRPVPDPLRDTAREQLLEARRTAPSVTARLDLVETEARNVSASEFREAHGTWTGSTWLLGCAGSVSGVEQLNVTKDREGGGYQQTISGYQIVLADSSAKPRELQFAREMAGPSMERVLCQAEHIFVFLRMRPDTLLVYRLAQDGSLAGTVRVVLPETSAFESGWGGLWRAAVTPQGELSVVLAEYKYPRLMGDGGALHRRHHYTVKLF